MNDCIKLLFMPKDVDAAKNELLEKAEEDSIILAEILFQSAGISFGKIKTIDYSWGELEIYSEQRYKAATGP